MEWLLVVWVFQKLLIYWDFHTQPSLGFTENGPKQKISSERQLCGRKCLVDVRGQRRMGRLVRDDRKATVTQITTRYNQGMQNTISECTISRTLTVRSNQCSWSLEHFEFTRFIRAWNSLHNRREFASWEGLLQQLPCWCLHSLQGPRLSLTWVVTAIWDCLVEESRGNRLNIFVLFMSFMFSPSKYSHPFVFSFDLHPLYIVNNHIFSTSLVNIAIFFHP